MFCSKCSNEIKDGDEKCSKCGNSVKSKKWKKFLLVAITIIVIVAIVLVVALLGKNNNANSVETATGVENSESKNTDFKSSSANASANGTSSISFANLKADDKSFDKTQKSIIDYFDNNYFEFGPVLAQQYPQIFKGAKVKTNAVILKVLKSTDDEFQVVAIQGGSLSADIWTGESSIYDAGYR